MATTALYMRVRHFFGELRGWGSVRDALAKAVGHFFPSRPPKHPFDRKHRVDTSGLIYADGLVTGHEHDSHSAGYYATAPSMFRRAMDAWTAPLAGCGFKLSDYTFLDIGCGKGSAVMLASEYGFRDVIGVEFNPRLAVVAQRNLMRWMRFTRACRNVRIIQGDALAIPIPDGPVVLYFFNPFEREMVELLLARLVEAAATRKEPIDLIYVHPEHGALFAQIPGMQVVSEEAIAFSDEDAAADVFGVI